LIGIWYLNEWQLLKNLYKNDLPDSISMIELGPGRGTLMSDVLRVSFSFKFLMIIINNNL
jgi:SAM-dependent MidA family methyltransferase